MALKKVKVKREDRASLAMYMNEIELLRRLRGRSTIVTLYDAQVDASKGTILMVRACVLRCRKREHECRQRA